MLKIIDNICSILCMLVMVACPIIFGYIHNYSAMWATLILGFFGMIGMAYVLEDIIKRYGNLDSLKNLPNDLQLNLNKETTERFLEEFFNKLHNYMQD